MNGKHIEEYKRYSGMYRYYISNFVNLHTAPFKNYKSKELMPKLRKHLEEVAGRWGRSLEYINQNGYRQWDDSSQCPLGSRSFGELMLGIAEEFLLEKLLFLRDYNKATDLALEYPCERLCAPFIVHFYRLRNRFYDITFDERIKRTEQLKKAFTKRMGKFEAVNSALLHFKQKSYLSATGKAAYEISKAFFNEASVSNRLKQIMFEIEHFVKYVLEDPCFFSDCNYWGQPHIGEEEGRKILEEIE
ncbi:MAG: hypothetical protein IJ793_03945 [Opitutales bacterium]|nr:hypothetical protein [Opitutales bacterium]